jgi:hypothetical protein
MKTIAVAGLLLAIPLGLPASAADLPIPPLLKYHSTRSALPHLDRGGKRPVSVPAATPAHLPTRQGSSSENSGSDPWTNVHVPPARSPDPTPSPPSPPAPPPAADDGHVPTFLERFGPYLKSRLEAFVTGSIGRRPASPPCESVVRSHAHRTSHARLSTGACVSEPMRGSRTRGIVSALAARPHGRHGAKRTGGLRSPRLHHQAPRAGAQ